MPSKIVKCNCKNTYQDNKYGKDQRVHNTTSKTNGVRCTVCGNEKTTTR
jgi:hypothetical protein